jgi:4-hydroxybenzoate polyprenyltransferase
MRFPPERPNLWPYLRLMRIPAVFTALSNILAAHLLATGGAIRGWPLVWLLAASACLYTAGMVLNDCFDLAEDRRERPQRPLPAGAVSVGHAWRLGWSLLVAGVACAAPAGLSSFLIAAVLALAVAGYDGGLKRTLLGGPLMGGCRYLNWLLGLSVVPLTLDHGLLGLPIFLYVVSLTLLSGVETSAHRRWPLYLCAGGLVLTTLLLILYHRIGLLPHGWALWLAAAGLLALLVRLDAARRDFSPARVQQTVGLLIFGIIPLDALMVFAGGPWWGGLISLMLMIPARWLGRVLYVT